eukprot:g2818.t1
MQNPSLWRGGSNGLTSRRGMHKVHPVRTQQRSSIMRARSDSTGSASLEVSRRAEGATEGSDNFFEEDDEYDDMGYGLRSTGSEAAPMFGGGTMGMPLPPSGRQGSQYVGHDRNLQRILDHGLDDGHLNAHDRLEEQIQRLRNQGMKEPDHGDIQRMMREIAPGVHAFDVEEHNDSPATFTHVVGDESAFHAADMMRTASHSGGGWSGPPPGYVMLPLEGIKNMRKALHDGVVDKVDKYRSIIQAEKVRRKKIEQKLDAKEEEIMRLKIKLEEADGGMHGVSKGRKTYGGTGRGNNQKNYAADAKRQAQKRRLLAGLVGDEASYAEDMKLYGTVREQFSGPFGPILRRIAILSKIVDNRLPLKGTVRQIESRYGQNVASFFDFFRFVIVNFSAVMIINIAFAVYHYVQLMRQNMEQCQKEGIDITGKHYCTTKLVAVPENSAWKISVSHTAFQEETIGGFFPKSLLPSSFDIGYYDSDNNKWKQSNEAKYFSGNILVSMLMLLYFGLRKLVYEDRMYKMQHAMEKSHSENSGYSKLVFSVWDHSIEDSVSAFDLKSATTTQLDLVHHQDEKAREIRERDFRTRWTIRARRSFGMFLYLIIQACGWVAIVMLTAQGAAVAGFFGINDPTLVKQIVPIAVSVLNAMIPTIIFMIIVKIEKWDDKKIEMKHLIVRVFIAKVLNIAIQVTSYALLADPYIFNGSDYFGSYVMDAWGITRDEWSTTNEMDTTSGYVDELIHRYVREKPRDKNDCRMDNVSVGLVNVVLVTFVTSKVMALLDPAVRFLRAKLSKKKVKWKKEFWVPFFVVNLVYFCTLNMMLMPFFPLAFALGSLLSILEFHFTRLRLKHLMYKPLVPYDAKDVGLFFTRLYLCSLFFGIVLSHFVLSSETFPRVLDLQPTTSEREIAAYAGVSPNDDGWYPYTFADSAGITAERYPYGWPAVEQPEWDVRSYRAFPPHLRFIDGQMENLKNENKGSRELLTPIIPFFLRHGLVASDAGHLWVQALPLARKRCSDIVDREECNNVHGGGLCIYQNETSRCSDYFAENNLNCVERMISSRPFSIDTVTRKELPPIVQDDDTKTCSADFSAYSRSLQSRFHPRQCVEILKNFTTYPGNNTLKEDWDQLHQFCVTVDDIWQDIKRIGSSRHEFAFPDNHPGTMACGPFISYRNGYAPILEYLGELTHESVVEYFVNAGTIALLPLSVAILLYIFRGNSMQTDAFANEEHVNDLMGRIEQLDGRIQMLQNKLKRQQAAMKTTL